MAVSYTQTASLRDTVLGNISNFLVNEGFAFPVPQHLALLKDGILSLVDQLADYREEGTPLFPEILISTDFKALISTLPTMARLDIAQGKELNVKGITKALKLCAPLATDGWHIYLDLKDGVVSYGVINGNLSETSTSILDMLSGFEEEEMEVPPFVYIRNLGYKNVQLVGKGNSLQVEFSLKDLSNHGDDFVDTLCESICTNIDETIFETAKTYFRKTVINANRIGHGTLIGVIEDSEVLINELDGHVKDGTILTVPVDIVGHIRDALDSSNTGAEATLKAYGSLLTGMINSDGITLFTNTGKLVGFHIFIKLTEQSKVTENGGARTKAFESMRDCGKFYCSFFKSQDGHEKITHQNG